MISSGKNSMTATLYNFFKFHILQIAHAFWLFEYEWVAINSLAATRSTQLWKIGATD